MVGCVLGLSWSEVMNMWSASLTYPGMEMLNMTDF